MIRANPTSDSGHRETSRRENERSLWYGLRRYPSCRRSPLSEVCSTHTRTDPRQPCTPLSNPHRTHDNLSPEDDAEQPTRHVVGFLRCVPHPCKPFRSTRSGNPPHYARPAVHTDYDCELPPVRVQSWPNLLASGSHRGDLDVEERMESHDRVDGRICLLLQVSLLPACSFFYSS